jgi:hypothetical protein
LNSDENPIERVLIAHHELAPSIEHVGVARREGRVIGKYDLALATDDVLIRAQVVAESLDAFPANQNEFGLSGGLQLAKVLGSRS